MQGVGFRFRTQAIAGRYAVTGFVKNLTDGRVQLVIEGNAGELDRLLAEIALEMRGNIHDTSVSTPATYRRIHKVFHSPLTDAFQCPEAYLIPRSQTLPNVRPPTISKSLVVQVTLIGTPFFHSFFQG